MLRRIPLIFIFLLLTTGNVLAQNRFSNSQNIPANPPPTSISFYSDKKTDEYILLIEKETQHLFLFASNGEAKKIYSLNCSTGKMPGTKTRMGDNKTPEGVYFFKKIYEKEELEAIYGIKAFSTDYPNLLDRIAEYTGGGIWLHGTNKPLKIRNSQGCIVLKDADVEKLTDYITLNRIPIVISQKAFYEPFRSEMKDSLLGLLSDWKNILEAGTYQEYSDFYASEYVPDITWWAEWDKIRNAFQISGRHLSLELKDILMVRYGKIFVILFDQVIKSSDKELFVGTKKIFISYDKDKPLRIVGEEYQFSPISEEKATPFIVTARYLKSDSLIAEDARNLYVSDPNLKREQLTENAQLEETIESCFNVCSLEKGDIYNYYNDFFPAYKIGGGTFLFFYDHMGNKEKKNFQIRLEPSGTQAFRIFIRDVFDKDVLFSYSQLTIISDDIHHVEKVGETMTQLMGISEEIIVSEEIGIIVIRNFSPETLFKVFFIAYHNPHILEIELEQYENYEKTEEKTFHTILMNNRNISDEKEIPEQTIAENNITASELNRYFIKAYKNKELEKAISDYLKENSGNAMAYNNIAWLYATFPDDKYRDSNKALNLARISVQISPNPDNLDTLAAAYAEAGMFKKAEIIQERVVRLLKKEDKRTVRDQFIMRLNTYKNNEPWRE